ncbi:MAG: integrase, partial [Candidatus Saccharimonadales bacterium]
MADYVSGSRAVSLCCQDKAEAYGYIERILIDKRYKGLPKPDKSTVRAYLAAVVGYSDTQLDRLIAKYMYSGTIKPAARTQPTFTGIYSREDIVELARIDDLYENMSGPAIADILKREYRLFGNEACARLQHLSVSHLYNLRSTDRYRQLRVHYTKTRPTKLPIGRRVKPCPDGRPGFLRVDSVHQGDKDGEKGVYHINFVDEVTQWEVVVAVEGLSERFMIPALAAALNFFPFVVLNFHADNGSEYMNYKVAELLERMLVKLTKSRPRHSGDNGLVETKNGGVIRKALGYLHIPRTADNVNAINRWYGAWFNPWLNFHRSCAFRVTIVDEKTGKTTHRYPKDNYQVPYEKLKSLPNAEQYLKPGITFELLDQQAYALSDTQWTEAMQAQK